MTSSKDIDTTMSAWLDERAQPRAPDGLLEKTIERTAQTPPRPAWRIPEWWLRLPSRLWPGASGRMQSMNAYTRIVAMVAFVAISTSLVVSGSLGPLSGPFAAPAANTFVVDPAGDGPRTITEAVEMAEDGDIILVRPGTYDESIVLTKDITIRGDGDRDTIVVELSVETPPGASGNAPDLPFSFFLDGSNATLENLTVRGESARIVVSGGAPLLQDLVLEGIGRVYRLDPGSSSVPTGLEINDGTTATIKDSLIADVDIDIETGSSPTIVGNEFSIGAIWMQGAGVDPVIRENVLDGSVKWGISIGGGAKPTIEANTIADAQTAIEIQDSGFGISDKGTDAVIAGNTITGATSVGISVGADASATILDNVLLDNGAGILVSSDAVVEGNRVEGGGGGIVVLRGSSSLVDNTIEGVETNGIFVGRSVTPTLSGNTSCNNGTNLKIVDDATPDIDDTNEICEDAPSE